jgi:hypothetical protein
MVRGVDTLKHIAAKQAGQGFTGFTGQFGPFPVDHFHFQVYVDQGHHMGHAVKNGFQIIRFFAFGISCHETAFGYFLGVW